MSFLSKHRRNDPLGASMVTEDPLRVYELAKKLDMQNKELVEKLQAAGLDVKTHSSSVEEAEAMKALKAKPVDDKKSDAAPAATATRSRPRTMVRMRREGEDDGSDDNHEPDTATVAEAPTPAVVVAPPPVEAAPSTKHDDDDDDDDDVRPAPPSHVTTERPMVQTSPMVVRRVEEPTPAPVVEAPAAVSSPDATSAPATPVESASTAPAAAAAVADATVDQQTNVVRVIDPNKIRERLQAEGRDFSPRPKKTFSRVREIKVVSDRFGGAPQMVDVTGNAGGARPSKKPPGKTATGGPDDYKDRREQRGNRDMWMNPGKKRKSGKKGRGPEITQAAAHKRVVELSDVISIGDLAHQMAIKAGQVITKLMSMGMMVTVNQTIDFDTATIVATEFGFETKNVAFEEADLLESVAEVEGEEFPSRAPVVTVMGHVDHGKTSLLDHIRKATVATGEAGGITQHIGAYSVLTDRGRITFLDTPGHEAFTAMRARGAQMTDIVILVVAADDGVMPQTIEAIHHAKDAGVPIVVAINKSDKPDARPERVMQELTEFGLVSEEWGGDTMMVACSAKVGTNVDKLLESVLLQAEVLQLQADPDRTARGAVVEAELDKGRGPVATVLIQSGRLSTGDFVVAGQYSGKVRAMYDSTGRVVETAGPSDPVQVLGLSGVPDAGDRFDAVTDDKVAKEVAGHRAQKIREAERHKTAKVSLEDFLKKTPASEAVQVLRVIVKADVGGSMEALSHALKNLSTNKVTVTIVASGVGTVTESDVNLAIASNAIIIGFNSKPGAKASALAQHEKVDIRTYNVIYDVLDEVRAAMTGLLAPKLVERYVGRAEARQIMVLSKVGTIAGSYVTDGKILRSAKVRVLRGKDKVFEGGLLSLKRFKDDVREVAAGYECGISLQGFDALQEGDIIECFDHDEVRPDLGEALSKTTVPGNSDNQAGASA